MDEFLEKIQKEIDKGDKLYFSIDSAVYDLYSDMFGCLGFDLDNLPSLYKIKNIKKYLQYIEYLRRKEY